MARHVSTNYKNIWFNHHLLTPLSLGLMQVSCYTSWGSDPGTSYANAFFDHMGNTSFYAFSSFKLIDQCLHAQDERVCKQRS